MRWGSPSLNAKFGNRVAILAGDILYSHAFELLAETTEKRIYMLLAKCCRQMCRGEIVNLSEHDFDDYQQIVSDKTAALMSFCCETGAMMVSEGERDSEKVRELAQFGYHYGMVYQLADDLGDCDDAIAMAHRPEVIELITEHRGAALQILSGLSPSVYVSSLGQLLEYVVERAEPVMAAAVGEK
jgi:geranylgeranyl pyrophosphate synthase